MTSGQRPWFLYAQFLFDLFDSLDEFPEATDPGDLFLCFCKRHGRRRPPCRPWLEAELRIVKPNLVVAMGATAAQAIFGPGFRVTRERGKVLSSKLAPRVLATVHPSSLLRQPDEESREREYKHFVADLRAAVKAAKE